MSFEPKKKRFRATLSMGGGLGLMALLSGCSKVSGLGYEKNLSSVNQTSISLWQGAWITAAVVGTFTAGLILYSSFAHRKKEGQEFPRHLRAAGGGDQRFLAAADIAGPRLDCRGG